MSEIREKWLKALRSGKYRQIQEHLRGPDGFCCLGVACEVLGYTRFRDHSYLADKMELVSGLYDLQLRLLFPEVGEEARKKIQLTLIRMNDDGRSFEEIAAFVEWAVDPEHPERRKPIWR